MMTVDVVVPVFNGAEFIEEAVLSILNQSYPISNVFVVNDGSTDSTESILKTIAEKDARLHIISKKNGGLSSARNAGISVSKSEFVSFLDADDVWYRTKIESQIKIYKESSDPKLGLVYCDYELIDSNGRPIPRSGLTLDITIRGDVRTKLIEGNRISSSGSGVLVRREVFDSVGVFDESLAACEDWDMWLRIADQYHVDFTSETAVKIRRHSSNMQSDTLRMVYNDLLVLSKFIDDPKMELGAWRSIYFSLERYCAPRLLLRLMRESKSNPNLRKLVRGIFSRPSICMMVACRVVINSNLRKRLFLLGFRLARFLKPRSWFTIEPSTPVVTVLIPARNASQYLEQSVRSILNQTLARFEILILDEASSDETTRLLHTFNDPRIRVLRSEKARSFYESVDSGIDRARGEFVALLAADDLSTKERLEKQAWFLKSRPEANIVTSLVDTISSSGEKLNILEADWRLSPEAYFYSSIFRETVCYSSLMFRKTAWAKLKEDAKLRSVDPLANLSLTFPIFQIGKVLVHFRKHTERFDLNPSVKESHQKARYSWLRQILESEIDTSSIAAAFRGFESVDSLRYLSAAELNSFAAVLGTVYEIILYSLPNFYQKNRMRSYLEEDFSLYRLALQAQGVSAVKEMLRRPNSVARIKGALHYMARCHGARFAYLLVRKDHL